MRVAIVVALAFLLAGCGPSRELEEDHDTEASRMQKHASKADIKCFEYLAKHDERMIKAVSPMVCSVNMCKDADTAPGETACYDAMARCYTASEEQHDNLTLLMTVDTLVDQAPMCRQSRIAEYYYQYRQERAKAFAKGLKSFLTFGAWMEGIDAVKDIVAVAAVNAGPRSIENNIEQSGEGNELYNASDSSRIVGGDAPDSSRTGSFIEPNCAGGGDCPVDASDKPNIF